MKCLVQGKGSRGGGGRDRLGRFHARELAQEYINVNDVLHLIKRRWCHSLFWVGKEQVTSEYPRVDVIKNVENIIYK